MIDSPDSVDRDDAVHVRRLEDGFAVSVHIADVARVVPKDGQVDQRARSRGRTQYLPDRTVGMLPGRDEQAAALQPDAPRPTCRISLFIGQDGQVRDVKVEPGRLEHPTVLSYQEAADAVRDTSHPAHEVLSAAHAVAGLLLARRRAGGALAIYDLTHGWATNEEGNVVRLGADERNAGYVIVQELMIAANEAVAHWCVERELPILFRNHRVSAVAPPREELLDDLTSVSAEPVGARLDAIRQRLSLVLKPAVYEPHVGGHFGLNLLAYTHVTSPLRRYPDLVNQRILLAAARGEPSPYTQDELAEYAKEINVIARRRRARRAERLKAGAMDELRRQLTSGVLRGLGPDDFHRVLKVAVAENRYSRELSEEILHRLDAGTLAPRDACQVLFFTSGDVWHELRERIAAWVATEPAHAITLVTMYTQLANAGEVEWETEDLGNPGQPCFAVEVSLVGADKALRSPRRSARSKREARQQAALGLIAILANVTDHSRDIDFPPPAESQQRGRVIPDGHPVAAVNELSQIGELRDVSWSFSRTGPAHEPVHSCTVHAVDVRTGETLAAGGSGPAKAAAKSDAAAALLQLLETEN